MKVFIFIISFVFIMIGLFAAASYTCTSSGGKLVVAGPFVGCVWNNGETK